MQGTGIDRSWVIDLGGDLTLTFDFNYDLAFSIRTAIDTEGPFGTVFILNSWSYTVENSSSTPVPGLGGLAMLACGAGASASGASGLTGIAITPDPPPGLRSGGIVLAPGSVGGVDPGFGRPPTRTGTHDHQSVTGPCDHDGTSRPRARCSRPPTPSCTAPGTARSRSASRRNP